MSDQSATVVELLKKPLRLLHESELSALGFRNPAAVKSGIDSLVACEEAQSALQSHGAQVLRSLTASCDPDKAFFALQRWLEAGGSASTISGIDAQFLDVLCQLFAATPALSEYFIRFPARTHPVIHSVIAKEVAGGAAWRHALRESLASCGPPFGPPPEGGSSAATHYSAQLACLRRMRFECMLQIGALDLCFKSPMRDTVRALSDLADAFLDAALEIAVERLRPRMGVLPEMEAVQEGESAQSARLPFVVFALGKLGGRELNYSSDIDLVYAYAGDGQTVGASRPVDYQTYFTAIGEELIAALDKVTENGRVYRVDLRLRPHGSAGALVNSAERMLNYFQTEGRTWERQAWLKARPAAGDMALGNKILADMQAFIFRRYLSLDAIGDLKALKRQIEMSVARRGESEDEVKLGRGGIRDIEFTVQFMQLLHGGEHPRVRGGHTLNSLYELRREGLLADRDVELLAQAYVFWRNLEHRLQLYGDLQVHKLPADPVVRRRIALSMGYCDSPASESHPALSAQDAFEIDRGRHADRTREVFMRLFGNLFRESGGFDGELSELLLAPQPDIQAIAALLREYGFANADSSASELIDLSREKLILTSPSRTRKFFASVAPPLLKALVATGEPDDALRRFSRIAGSLGAKAVFYQMLNENPWLLKMTADLAAWSEYLTDILVANPGLFDELVDALQTGQSKTSEEMHQELSAISQGGDIADTLRAYRAGELLRIGVRDLIHDASLEQTQHELSDLAEAILRIQVQHCLKQHRERRGELTSENGKPVGFAVLALGKFGGREMNYGSDLDVIFFYGSDGQTSEGLPAATYFAELAQDLTRTMATPTLLGSLYELDARLRPMGTKGPLALSLDYFRKYWNEGQLADWERLALTRVRQVAGDEGVGERALHLVRSAVYSPLKDTASLATEVQHMRKRLEESADRDDLKRGRGGIMDIEFLAQYLQLIHGPAFPPLRQANTEQAIKSLVKFKKLSSGDGNTLLQAYLFLRRMENRVRIVHGLSAHKLPPKPEALRKLALRAGYADSPSKRAEAILIDDYHKHAEHVRGIFERVVGPVS